MSKMLMAEGINVQFGGLTVINDVSMTLRRGEILGLIGPNGAGKTTFVNVLSGFQKPDCGEVFLDGTAITRWKPEIRARSGLTRTFQAVRLFKGLSVQENVSVAALAAGQTSKEAYESVNAALRQLDLLDVRHLVADSLPYGYERRVGVARALVTNPDYILLDEPAAGLNETEGEELHHFVLSLRDRTGCGVLLIEHNMKIVFGLCERVHVLHSGETLAEGTPDQVREHDGFREAYLGSAA
jgi:branched-chain amino acid transport system ATP-binding protein